MTPEEIIGMVCSEPDNHPIIRRICLTSGGGDSTVLAHRCRDFYDELVHIDTGTALPGVRDFVQEFADWLGKPLRIADAAGAYHRLVLGHPSFWPIFGYYRMSGEKPDEYRRRISTVYKGDSAYVRKQRMLRGLHMAPMGFPGPGGHRFAYQLLKERPLAELLSDVKDEFGTGRRKQRVMLLSGVRMDESQRRKMHGTAQGHWERRGNQVWVNPLLDWTNGKMQEYRTKFNLPISEATALTHRSGECNCLAFVAQGERDFVISMYPEWYRDTILPMEKEAERLGLERCKWGWADKESVVGYDDIGPMCRACELKAREIMA